MDDVTEEEENSATYCFDCSAIFVFGEEGYSFEECLECGESNCFEINY